MNLPPRSQWSRTIQAFKQVQDGLVKKIEVDDNVQVYRCGSVIRIDVKVEP